MTYSCANDECANYSIRFTWDNADEGVVCRQCGQPMSTETAPSKRATK